MIKGFGSIAFVLFLALCFEIGSFGPGFAIWFLSLLLLVAGVVAAAFFYAPVPFEKQGLLQIQLYTRVDPKKTLESIYEIASHIRKDGLLSLESVRGGITDQWLLYVTRKMMEGFDAKAVLPVLQNNGKRSLEMFEALEKYFEQVLGIIPVLGLVGSVAHLMFDLAKPDSNQVAASFVPFLLSLIIQLLGSFWVRYRFDDLQDRAKNYHAVMEEGAAGLFEGVHADLLRDRMINRITHA